MEKTTLNQVFQILILLSITTVAVHGSMGLLQQLAVMILVPAQAVQNFLAGS